MTLGPFFLLVKDQNSVEEPGRVGCAVCSLRSLREEDKYPRELTALSFRNLSLMEIPWARKKNLEDKDRSGEDLDGEHLG